MMSDGATRRGTGHSVPGHMTGKTADHGTLEAASRLGLSDAEHRREGKGRSDSDEAHCVAPRSISRDRNDGPPNLVPQQVRWPRAAGLSYGPAEWQWTEARAIHALSSIRWADARIGRTL